MIHRLRSFLRAFRGRRPTCLYILAFTLIAVGVAIDLLQTATLLPVNWFTSWAIGIGSALGTLVLGLGLMDTLNSRGTRKLEAERQAYKTSAVRLEQEVRERTRERDHANQRLQALEVTDELTGAFNRRHFNELCDKVLTRELRDEPLAFCILDIDHFRSFNDLLGLEAGDQALQAVARTIQDEQKRASDLLFRLGGEEFGVLFTANSPETAWEFAVHLQKIIREQKIRHPASDTGCLTVSIGLVWCSPLSPTSREEIYDSARKLLRQAKDSGRNRIEILEL